MGEGISFNRVSCTLFTIYVFPILKNIVTAFSGESVQPPPRIAETWGSKLQHADNFYNMPNVLICLN